MWFRGRRARPDTRRNQVALVAGEEAAEAARAAEGMVAAAVETVVAALGTEMVVGLAERVADAVGDCSMRCTRSDRGYQAAHT